MSNDKTCDRCANAVKVPIFYKDGILYQLQCGKSRQRMYCAECPHFEQYKKNDNKNELIEATVGLNKFKSVMEHCGASYSLSYKAALDRLHKAVNSFEGTGTNRTEYNQGSDTMAKETDKLKMVDIKFADRFLEDLWTMNKTCTTRKSKKGSTWDRFVVTYNDINMEFEITNVTHCKKMSMGIAKEIYGKEGFDNPREFMNYLDGKGYTGDVYIHDFRMVRQCNKNEPVMRIEDNNISKPASPKTEVTMLDNARMMKELSKEMEMIRCIRFGNTYGFDTALRRLKDSHRQQREGWNGKGMYIEMQVPDEHSKMSRPYLYIKSVDGDLVPWVASQTDLLADDWREYEPPKD